MNGKALNAASIFKAGRGSLIRVDLPGITNEDGSPGFVYLQQMSARNVMAFADRVRAVHKRREEGIKPDAGTDDELLIQLETIEEVVVDEDRNRLFGPEDREALLDLPTPVFNAMVAAINAMMGIRAKEEEGKG